MLVDAPSCFEHGNYGSSQREEPQKQSTADISRRNDFYIGGSCRLHQHKAPVLVTHLLCSKVQTCLLDPRNYQLDVALAREVCDVKYIRLEGLPYSYLSYHSLRLPALNRYLSLSTLS